MALKTNGAEFKRFYTDAEFWPEGRWHEEVEITIEVNGTTITDHTDYDLGSVPDHAKLTLGGGCVQDEDGNEFGTLDAYFRKWRKKQNTTFLLISVPVDKLDAVTAAISAAGAKVVK